MNTYGNVTDTDAWEPIDAKVTSCPHCRSQDRYREVLSQFNVKTNPRYTARPDAQGRLQTYCNIFVADATKALGCEIDHWWLGKELNANAVHDWLEKIGSSYGWIVCDGYRAVLAATQGHPAVVVWKNPQGGSGHVAMVLPSTGQEIRIAQAGRNNLFDAPLKDGFGNVAPLKFYYHP
jgi:hypothetical protein